MNVGNLTSFSSRNDALDWLIFLPVVTRRPDAKFLFGSAYV